LAETPTATDNCSTPTINLVSDITTAGSCPSAYTEVRTWNFTDACGNTSANLHKTINVGDHTAPVVTTAPGSLDANLELAMRQDIAAALAETPTATDNCSTPTIN